MNSPAFAQSARQMRSERTPTVEWWLAKTRHRNHRGQPLDFTSHRFLAAIYQDTSPDVVIRSSAQSGKSEYLLTYALANCDQGLRVFWVFPTDALRNQLVNDRVDRTIASTAHYQRLLELAKPVTKGKDATDAVTLKQLGSASIAFVGSNSSVSFRSFSADVEIEDEVDECDADNLATAPDRLQHSRYGFRRRVGNPTVAGYGIDALYRDSDQKRWTIKCEHCGEWQSLDWFANVVREVSEGRYELRFSEPYVAAACAHCDRPIDRLVDGKWIAAYPGRATSGYHISQLFAGSRPLAEMWLRFERGLTNQSAMQAFYNGSLGLPYSAPGASLTQEILSARTSDHPRLSQFDGDCYGGCDVGSLNHLVIESDNRRVILIEAVTWSRLDEVMSLFPRLTLVIDALPELNRCMEWAAKYPGRVYRSYVNKKTQRDEPFVLDYSKQETSGERTQMIDRAFARFFKADSIYLPRDAASVEGFKAHMTAPSRVLDIKRTPPAYIWTEGAAPDHYAMATVYMNWSREIAAYGGGLVFFG